MKHITRTVWILSLVSLFTDMASEMLYPVMPIYLKSIGFSVLLIGILEGLAEATAGLSKGYFGSLSDHLQKRAPFVQLGYSLSAISKPLTALFVQPLWIFFTRTLDRLGKGLRTGARDAILSSQTTKENKATVFGFHRSMDTLGAVLGPAFALLYLYFYPQDYLSLFYIAFIPGIFAIFSSFLIRDSDKIHLNKKESPGFLSFLKYWKTSSPEYRKLLIGLLLFALINSSDVFLLLKAKQSGIIDSEVIGVYIFYNLVYALFAFPAGILADKIGMKRMFMTGLGIFGLVYIGMGLNSNLIIFICLFFLYGLYAAFTEGISKAWISKCCKKEETATAIGTYSAFQSIVTLISSSLAGLIWYQFGAEVLFIFSGIAAVFLIFYFTLKLQ